MWVVFEQNKQFKSTFNHSQYCLILGNCNWLIERDYILQVLERIVRCAPTEVTFKSILANWMLVTFLAHGLAYIGWAAIQILKMNFKIETKDIINTDTNKMLVRSIKFVWVTRFLLFVGFAMRNGTHFV